MENAPLKEFQPYSPEQRQRLEQNFSNTTELLDDMIGQALAGGLRDHRRLAETAENYVTELCDDADHVIAPSTEMAPLLAPDRQELRLEEGLMGKVLWEGLA